MVCGDARICRSLPSCPAGALVARSKTFRDHVMLNKFILGASDEVLLPWCKRYQMMVAQVITIGPNSPAQPLHRDRDVWPQGLLGEAVEPQMATIWALTDFTRENGATRIVPSESETSNPVATPALTATRFQKPTLVRSITSMCPRMMKCATPRCPKVC